MIKHVLQYFGAKTRLAPKIVQVLQVLPHTAYVEPFAGSAAVLLSKPRVKYELLNDLDGQVVNFFRVLREQPEALARALWATPYAREELWAAYEPTDDPLERARRFAVISRQSIGHDRSWRYAPKQDKLHAPAWAQVPELVLPLAERLRGVHIDCRDAREVIRAHAQERVLLYVDPPYPHSTRASQVRYNHELSDEEHVELLELLRAHPGPVAISGYHCELYDRTLSDWRVVEFQLPTRGRTSSTEVLWYRGPLRA